MNDVPGGMPPRPFDLEALRALQDKTLSMDTEADHPAGRTGPRGNGSSSPRGGLAVQR